MEEKYLVKDIIDDFKNHIKLLTESILEAENVEIRAEIQKIRNEYESFLYNLYKIAEAKGYYNFGLESSKTQIEKIKENLDIK